MNFGADPTTGLGPNNSIHIAYINLEKVSIKNTQKYCLNVQLTLTSTEEFMLLLEPEVLAIQWPYPFSGPSTLISAKCCWSAIEKDI